MKLDVAPASDVVIDLEVTGDSDVTVMRRRALTFTAGQLVHRADRWWCPPQHDDDIADGLGVGGTHTVDDANSDDAYDGLSIDSVAVSVADDDVTATVSVSELEVAEGGVGDLHGEAGRGPGESDVVIDLEVTGDSDVTVSEASVDVHGRATGPPRRQVVVSAAARRRHRRRTRRRSHTPSTTPTATTPTTGCRSRLGGGEPSPTTT